MFDPTIERWLAMLPCWVRYCADRDSLAPHLTEAALEALPCSIEELDIPEHKRLSHIWTETP
ncbi:hypothetical protein [Glycomyces tenuis]|uniref:hypothetical protein n=1 Tax=Glycomyces tenuis TaxID=58116 RepID=UPI00040F9EDA|nr:hypothetical protein [Glycomyces tenuis]